MTQNENGTYTCIMTSTKATKISEFIFTLGGKIKTNAEIERIDFPSVVNVTPGPCGSTYVQIDTEKYLKGKSIKVGQKQTIQFVCYDQYKNPSREAFAADFQVSIRGEKLESVGEDTVQGTWKTIGINEFSLSFLVAWPGTYHLSITYRGSSYYNLDDIAATLVGCTAADKPYYCTNTQSCAASYKDCKFDFLNAEVCKEEAKPFSCLVGGLKTCVASQTECDCDANSMKCSADKKCVPNNMPYLCSDVILRNCPAEYPVQCPNGQCRAAMEDCPSKKVCPPGYNLCSDLTCVDSTVGCKNDNFIICPNERMYKCEDQTCVQDPSLCPT